MITIKPRITEKAYQLSQQTLPQFTFTLPTKLRKEDIRRFIEKQYNVHVVDLQTIHVAGKVRVFKRIKGKLKDTYKAIVRLAPGEHIAEFDVPAAEPTTGATE